MQHDRETIENFFTLARNNLFRRRSVIPVTTRNQVERAGKKSEKIISIPAQSFPHLE
jgi:hypothetical protein